MSELVYLVPNTYGKRLRYHTNRECPVIKNKDNVVEKPKNVVDALKDECKRCDQQYVNRNYGNQDLVNKLQAMNPEEV